MTRNPQVQSSFAFTCFVVPASAAVEAAINPDKLNGRSKCDCECNDGASCKHEVTDPNQERGAKYPQTGSIFGWYAQDVEVSRKANRYDAHHEPNRCRAIRPIDHRACEEEDEPS